MRLWLWREASSCSVKLSTQGMPCRRGQGRCPTKLASSLSLWPDQGSPEEALKGNQGSPFQESSFLQGCILQPPRGKYSRERRLCSRGNCSWHNPDLRWRQVWNSLGCMTKAARSLTTPWWMRREIFLCEETKQPKSVTRETRSRRLTWCCGFSLCDVKPTYPTVSWHTPFGRCTSYRAQPSQVKWPSWSQTSHRQWGSGNRKLKPRWRADGLLRADTRLSEGCPDLLVPK